MPPTKRRQSNAMLYTLITFIGLFVISATAAVIFYVKSEDLRTEKQTAEQQRNELANSEEQRTLGTLVGPPLRGQSYMGTMIAYLDRMVRLVKGGPIQQTTAQVKVDNSMAAVKDLLAQAQTYITLPVVEPNVADANAAAAAGAEPNTPGRAAEPNAVRVATSAGAAKTGVVDPNRIALTAVMRDLLAELGNTVQERDSKDEALKRLRGEFDDAIASMEKTRADLTSRVAEYRDEVDKIKNDYNDLRVRAEQASKEQVQVARDRLAEVETDAQRLNADLLKTQAELTVAQNRLHDATTEVNAIKPPPDRESTAYQPDGKVILVDDGAGVVRLNLGSNDHVYRGLTFSVYDKARGIPRDGKPKAELEVFIIDPEVCAARIMSSDRRNPVCVDDLVANLIWDSSRQNEFVIAGEFDLDRNGRVDYDAIPRIEALIRKWGGTVADDVSATADYVILGTKPRVPAEPTLQQTTVDPMATDRYNAAKQRLERYEQIRQHAESLWVPIFTYERFLCFTGYANQVDKPGAFE
jgi:archaellum component FlaC